MGASLYGGFSALTFGYFIIRHLIGIGKTPTLKDKTKELGLLLIYFVIIIICIVFIPVTDYDDNCSSKDISKITSYIIIYWILLFLLGAVLLMFFPGWSKPFSNTYGYLTIYLMGKLKDVDKFVITLMNKAQYSDVTKKDRIKCLLTDHSLFLNEVSPYNVDNYIEMDIGTTNVEDILNTPGFSEHTYKNSIDADPDLKQTIEAFKSLLNIKESVGLFIWYILLGFTTIMITSNVAIQSKCQKKVDDIETNNNDKTSLVE